MNEAIVEPARTVTDEGTVTDDELLASAMAIPPDPAAELRLTVPVETLPPTTGDGLTVMDVIVGGLIVNMPLTVAPESPAVS